MASDNSNAIRKSDILTLLAIGGERELVTIAKEKGWFTFTLGSGAVQFGPKDMATIAETVAGFALNAGTKHKRAGLEVFAAGFTNLVPMMADMARGFVSGTARTPQSLRQQRVIQRPAIGMPQSARPSPYAQRVTSYQGIAQPMSNYPRFT